ALRRVRSHEPREGHRRLLPQAPLSPRPPARPGSDRADSVAPVPGASRRALPELPLGRLQARARTGLGVPRSDLLAALRAAQLEGGLAAAALVADLDGRAVLRHVAVAP